MDAGGIVFVCTYQPLMSLFSVGVATTVPTTEMSAFNSTGAFTPSVVFWNFIVQNFGVDYLCPNLWVTMHTRDHAMDLC